MSSNYPNSIITPLGIILPAKVVATIRDYEEHPERGRLLERINPRHRQDSINSEQSVATTKKPRHNKNKHQATSSKRFKCTSCEPGVIPSIDASIGIVSIDKIGTTKIIDCKGYVISIIPNEPYWAVLVLNIPPRGNVPCLCPTYLLDDSAIKAAEGYTSSLTDTRKSAFCPYIENITFTTADACRENTHGHMILTGPQGIRGRVVDSSMLKCLKAGCLREGKHSTNAYT